MKKFLKAFSRTGLALVTVLCMMSSFAMAADELPGPDTSKEVKELEVYQLPDKTVYLVGEEFSAEGGIVKIIYEDGSEGYISMTDEAITMKAPAMKSVNT